MTFKIYVKSTRSYNTPRTSNLYKSTRSKKVVSLTRFLAQILLQHVSLQTFIRFQELTPANYIGRIFGTAYTGYALTRRSCCQDCEV